MKVFCEDCREMVDYVPKDLKLEKSIKSKTISFIGKEAYCPVCGNKLFVSSLRDYNLKQLDNEFRKTENLITVEQIQQILDKYNIGKRPLSELLGWGEITLSRYLDGAIPTKQYSEKLFEILNNENYMLSILKKNREKISDIAYQKCEEAIIKLKSNATSNPFHINKIDNVTRYFLANLSDVTPLALQKLLYYAQGFYTAFNNVYLFNDDCEAWIHGPVYSEIYLRYKDFGYNPIENAIACSDLDFNLTNNEKEILDSVMSNFGCYSGKVLEKMTHSESPWLESRIGLSDDMPSNIIIKRELISHYFAQIKTKYRILNTSDIRDYSKDLFDKLFK